MESEFSLQEFINVKKQLLEKDDGSKKGGIDVRIVDTINLINGQEDFVTTSSCSGRIIVYTKPEEPAKKGCKWLYCSHDIVHSEDAVRKFLSSVTESSEDNITIKFEPFILHVQCRTLKAAKCMLSCAVGRGFRNSGISFGKSRKILVAVRSSLNLEVPVVDNGRVLVDEMYVKYLLGVLNAKMASNFSQIEEFYNGLSKLFSGNMKQDGIT